MNALAWLGLVAILAAAALALYTSRQLRDGTRQMELYAHHDLEVVRELRLPLEDLLRRDPQLEETVSVSLLRLERRAEALQAIADNDWAAVRRIARELDGK